MAQRPRNGVPCVKPKANTAKRLIGCLTTIERDSNWNECLARLSYGKGFDLIKPDSGIMATNLINDKPSR
jgi:hypothetical protein